MKGLATLVSKGICVPDTILMDAKDLEDSSKATL
jgi:hypothetical protein